MVLQKTLLDMMGAEMNTIWESDPQARTLLLEPSLVLSQLWGVGSRVCVVYCYQLSLVEGLELLAENMCVCEVFHT